MKIFKYLSVVLKSITHKKISYSYGGIDAIVENIFKDKKKGIYVDIGCCHPIKDNNTYLLNKKGWSGINIDLDPDNINLFNIFRSKDHIVTAAISDEEKMLTYFFITQNLH